MVPSRFAMGTRYFNSIVCVTCKFSIGKNIEQGRITLLK
jgi:hypothetical protein